MPYLRDITAADEVFFDTDILLRFTVYDGNPTAEEIANETATPIDVDGWALEFIVRKKPNSADPALIRKTIGDGITITGTFGGSPIQRVEVLLEDTDTYDPDGSPEVLVKEGDYVYALKRVDEGSETILAYGKFKLLRAAAWE